MFFFIFNFFNGRLSSPSSSETNGPSFTKISGLVDGYKGLVSSLSSFRFLTGCCNGNQLNCDCVVQHSDFNLSQHAI